MEGGKWERNAKCKIERLSIHVTSVTLWRALSAKIKKGWNNGPDTTITDRMREKLSVSHIQWYSRRTSSLCL
jgi:hypothetical protein